MKKFATILFTIALLSSISYTNTSCEEYQEDVSLSVNPPSLTFKADADTVQVVVISTDARIWKATANTNWIQILDLGDKIDVSVDKYEGKVNRTAKITINADGRKQVIQVTQNAVVVVTPEPTNP